MTKHFFMMAAILCSAFAALGQTRMENGNWSVDVGRDGKMAISHKSGAQIPYINEVITLEKVNGFTKRIHN